jgi:hypothetical protein
MPTKPALKWHRAIPGERWGQAAADGGAAMARLFVGLFLSAVLLLAFRRIFGALVNPLPVFWLIFVGVLAGLLVESFRAAGRFAARRKTSFRHDLVFKIVITVSLLILAATLSLPGTNVGALAFFWLFLIGEETWAWRRAVRKGTDRRRKNIESLFQNSPLPLGEGPGVRAERLEAIVNPLEIVEPPDIADDEESTPSDQPGEEVTQQLIRSLAADGIETLSGWLRLRFSPGQRTGNAHVAFCPPFPQTPELTVSQLDGPEARIKIAQLLPYGARLELKLLASYEEPSNVLLQFSARTAGG